MSIKMESELNDQFMAVVATTHTPSAPVVRQLMRKFIALHEIQNPITVAAMEAVDRGEGACFDAADDLFKDLDI